MPAAADEPGRLATEYHDPRYTQGSLVAGSLGDRVLRRSEQGQKDVREEKYRK